MNNFEDILEFILIIFGICGFFAVIIFIGMSWECNSYQEMTNKQTKLSGGSCYVKDNNEWYRWDEYKYRFATKGERK